MSSSHRFLVPGSPLHGREVPQDWARMDLGAKRKALVSYGYAEDYSGACRLMGQHAAAVRRGRRVQAERAANRRQPEGPN
jgi:hypothetical protein